MFDRFPTMAPRLLSTLTLPTIATSTTKPFSRIMQYAGIFTRVRTTTLARGILTRLNKLG
jgi:hypothetical protein